jgi:hypothetical protein
MDNMVFEDMSDNEKAKEILFYGKVLSKDLLCKRFNIDREELDRILCLYFLEED